MVGKILVAGLVCGCAALGQTATAPDAPSVASTPTTTGTPAPAKAYAFEVVSIRQNTSGMPGDYGGPTADGYRMTDMPMDLVIKTAFVPQVGGAAFYSP